MRIETYFSTLQKRLWAHPSIAGLDIGLDTRSATVGYIRGQIYFDDGHILHVREYVDTEGGPVKYLYVYHFMAPDGTQVFRYDNSGHHRELRTFPHHRHGRTDEKVSETAEPDLDRALDEAEQHLDFT